MNKISIGFSKPKKWKLFAWLIQQIEGTNFSHVFVTWHCSNIDRRKVFESVGSGTRILSNVNFKKHAELIELYNFYVDDLTLFKIEQKTHDLTGKPYGYKAIIGLGLMRLCNYFYRKIGSNKRIGNIYKDGDYSQICVESGAIVIQEIIELSKDIENYGLIEFNKLVNKFGEKVPQEKLDRINGKTH